MYNFSKSLTNFQKGTPIFFLFLFYNSIVFGQPQSLLYRTETKVIHSDIVGEDFEIYISLPVDYYRSDTTYYPVLYSPDANRNFGLLSNIVNILSFPGNEIPQLIVVGIGYRIKGLEDWAAWRRRDLVPTSDSAADSEMEKFLSRLSGRDDIVSRSGGAHKYLDFIREELIPDIESNYRVKKNNRTLAGYSLGGLFTLYALFTNPEEFQNYYAGSPSIWWDNKVIFEYEKKFAQTHSDLPVTLFTSVGSEENPDMIANLYEMVTSIKLQNYPNLRLMSYIIEGESHSSGYAEGFNRALMVIYGH